MTIRPPSTTKNIAAAVITTILLSGCLDEGSNYLDKVVSPPTEVITVTPTEVVTVTPTEVVTVTPTEVVTVTPTEVITVTPSEVVTVTPTEVVTATPTEVDNTISSISIADNFYPVGFEQELQSNLDYFIDGVGVSVLAKVPVDNILVTESGYRQSSYTSSSAIALYINLLVEMYDNGDNLALVRIEEVLSKLEDAPKWKGLFYWLYEIDHDQLNITNKSILSSVDNGILSFSLAALSGAFNGRDEARLNAVANRVNVILANQRSGWLELYDPIKGLLRAGWSREASSFLPYYIDRKSNESRLATLWAVLSSQGSIPESIFTNMELVVGDYNFNGDNLQAMMTWDGSYFQALLPSLLLDEKSLVPDYQMFIDFTELHKEYADIHGIPFVSASATVQDGYGAYGLKKASESYQRYANEMIEEPTGSPHTLALYYMIAPDDAIKRLKQLKSRNPTIQTSAGWRDAINESGEMSSKIIALDQGMFVGSFVAESVRANVSVYMQAQGYTSNLQRMYSFFVADQVLEVMPAPLL